MYRILIIEDDSTIAGEVCEHLKRWDYDAKYVTDFKNIVKEVIDFQPHIVLLDIMLPYFNGFHWCTEIRKVSPVPIVFISSASDNMNIVMAMNMGGDDFISKPFDLSVLTAKVQAIIRRSYAMSGQLDTIEHNGVILNLSSVNVSYNNHTIPLTKNEFGIMRMLMENAGKTVSRDEIMERLWENENFIDDNTLTVNVTRLRKKLEEAGLKGFIVTKKKMGYMVE